MPAGLRRTGIPVLGSVPWGAHACLFYETRQDLLDTLVAFFEAGVQQNEFCMWVASDPVSEEDARTALLRRAPKFAQHLASGRIEITPCPQRLDIRRRLGHWRENLQRALDRGFDGMRVSANAFWFGEDYRGEFSSYERELNGLLADRPVLGLCTYPLQASSGKTLLYVARARDIAIVCRHGNWEVIEAFAVNGAPARLTGREREVLTWTAHGKSAWEIGEILSITKRTVDEHVHRAVQKLGASNRTQAVAIAVREGLVIVSGQQSLRASASRRNPRADRVLTR